MRTVLAGILVCSIAAVACGQSIRVEGRTVAQGAGLWMMDVVFEQPQQISLRLPGDARDTRYWYVILSITNGTGSDIGFYPVCELMTDTYQILQAGAGVGNEVFESIKARHRDRYPFLESLERSIGSIPQGSEHTKDVLVVWKDFDSDARGVKFFFAGLSNETQSVEKPAAAGEVTEQVILRKTLVLEYGISGDPAMRTQASLVQKGRQWVMR